jgi:signal peptidase I
MEIGGGELLALKREWAGDGKRMVYRTALTGRSMWPIIREGDGIVVEQVAEEALRVGDVLVFAGKGARLVAHRLVRRERHGGGWRYVTRGDNGRRLDEPMEFGAIVGKVVEIDRAGRVVRTAAAGHRLRVRLWLVLRPFAILARGAWRRVRAFAPWRG